MVPEGQACPPWLRGSSAYSDGESTLLAGFCLQGFVGR